MKLAAFCIAALSLTACVADEDYGSGGQLEGMRPSKPSIDDLNSTNGGLSPNLDGIAESQPAMGGPTPPAPGTDTVVLRTYNQKGELVGEELQVFDGGMVPLCRIFLNTDGEVISDDCEGRL